MKIRCKNCYRVLDRNEEYCKSCGEHSEAMKQAMITGNFSGGPLDRLKIGLILFFTLAFLGNGIIMTLLAVIKEDATMSLYNRSYAMIFSICNAASAGGRNRNPPPRGWLPAYSIPPQPFSRIRAGPAGRR